MSSVIGMEDDSDCESDSDGNITGSSTTTSSSDGG
eukprot:CAMPEP_0178704940 /NCGR_PEP_ID=MMETSP0699-20121125/14490_1 /TAXON_ID=265572 /ORGANISM="Extubocellulus spinifer, Strain CCMP396" /LENGTH=34 /DNA_ID= /DNA_START= /DNA_END= /DNA_ORIENTATION=